jgi:hypothetical protein
MLRNDKKTCQPRIFNSPSLPRARMMPAEGFVMTQANLHSERSAGLIIFPETSDRATVLLFCSPGISSGDVFANTSQVSRFMLSSCPDS